MAKRSAICKLCNSVFEPADLGFCETCNGLFCEECEGLHKCPRMSSNGAGTSVGLAVAPKVSSRIVGTQVPPTKTPPPAPPKSFEVVPAELIPTSRCSGRDLDPTTLAFIEAFRAIKDGSAVRWPLTLDPKERATTKARVKNLLARRDLAFGSVCDHEWIYVWPVKKKK